MTVAQPLDPESAAALAAFFTAMSDPTRVRLISALADAGAEWSVQELAQALDMTHSAVSHQLRLLRQLRVVKVRRDGRFHLYSLDDDHIAQLYREGLEHIRHG